MILAQTGHITFGVQPGLKLKAVGDCLRADFKLQPV